MYTKILVPVDGSPTAECGLQEALKLAKGSSTALRLLYVVDQYPMLVDFAAAASYQEVQDDLRRYGKEVLAKAQAAAQAVGVAAEVVEREVIGGRVADVVVGEAEKAGCDLIVMGTHGRRGLSRLTLGSDAELVVRHAPVPVLLVRHSEAPR